MALLLLLGGFVTLIEANVKTSGAEIFEGKGATLKCQPSEAGGSKVYWKFTNQGGEQQTIFASDGQFIGIKDGFQGKWENPPGTFDIRIAVADRYDNGTYTCLGILPGSNVFTSDVDLLVKVPPSVPYIDDPSDSKLTLGEAGRIHCLADDGIPTPKYTWLKCSSQDPSSCREMPDTAQADRQQYANSSFQLVQDPATGDKIIQFHQVSQGDQGYYQCVAKNSAGEERSAVVFIEATTVSMASVVGIVFGVIFGVAFLLVLGFFAYKKFSGDDDDDDYDEQDGANDVFIGEHHTDHSRLNTANNRHEHSMVV